MVIKLSFIGKNLQQGLKKWLLWTTRQQAHLVRQEGTRRLHGNSRRHGRRQLTQAAGGTLRRQCRAGGVEHRAPGEEHRNAFR
jgi:hypothetical protein